MACNVQGSPGICTVVPAGGAPRTPSVCPASAASSCGLDGTCDGSGALPPARRGNGVQGGRVFGRVGGRRQRLRRRRATASRGRRRSARRSTAIRPRAPASATCRSNADCVPGVLCVNGSCGPKPPGAMCAQGRRLRLRLLRRRGLLQRRLPRRVRQLQPDGPARDVLAGRSRRRRSARHVPRQGAGLVRPDGRLRRRGRLLALRARDDLRRAVVQRRPAQHRRHLQRHRHLPPAGRAGVRPLPLHRRRLHRPLHRRRRLRRRPDLPERELRPEAQRPAVCRRRRVHQQVLRRRRLLRRGVRRRVPQLRAAVVDGTMRAGRGRCRRSPQRLHRQGRQPAAAPTENATAPSGCRKYHGGDELRARELHERRLHAARGVRRDGPMRRAQRHRLRAVRLQRSALLRRLHGRRQLRGRQGRASTTPAASSRTAPSAPTGASASRATARRASAARRGCASACKSCALTASMGICTNVPDGQPDPTGTCLDAGAASCGSNGKCQAGACQSYAAGNALPARHLPHEHDHVHARRDLRRRGNVLGRRRRPRVSRSAAAPPRASRPARRTRTARPPACASTARAASSPTARSAAAGSECASGICAQGVCCRTACAGTCLSCALPGSTGHLQAGRRPARPIPPGQCRDQGARQLREQRSLRRRGRLPAVRGRHGVRAADLPGRHGDRDAGAHAATGREPASRRRPSRARPTPATARPAAPRAAQRHRLRRRHGLQRAARAARSGSVRSAPPAASATAATASTASAARRRAAGPACPAT